MHNMREAIVPLLSTYIHLTAAQAVALVRAARLYQDAIWVAEAQPELAWLLFVSAIEVVATQHQVESNVPADLLQAAYPDLYTTLARAGSGTLVAECADHLARLLRATQRFLKFTLDFLPPEPPRPDKQQVDLIPWKPQTLRPILSRIYEYRSRALHDGIPFPKPMCDAPEFAGWYHERPGGLASGTNDAAWLREDTPVCQPRGDLDIRSRTTTLVDTSLNERESLRSLRRSQRTRAIRTARHTRSRHVSTASAQIRLPGSVLRRAMPYQLESTTRARN